MDRMAGGTAPARQPRSSTLEHIARAREVVHDIYVDEKVKDYIVDVVFATREPGKYGLKDLADFIQFGASPRATIALALAARAHAFLRRRGYVTPEDVKAVGLDVLRHRVSRHLRGRGRGAHLARRSSSASSTASKCPKPRSAPERPVLPKELIRRIRKLEIRTRKVVNDMLAGQYHSVFKGRGMAFAEVRAVPARRRRPHHRLERHRAHERALRQGLRRGARAHRDARGGRVRLRGVRLGASAPRREIAAEMAALLAFSAIANNDRVGLILFTDRVEKVRAAAQGPQPRAARSSATSSPSSRRAAARTWARASPTCGRWPSGRP